MSPEQPGPDSARRHEHDDDQHDDDQHDDDQRDDDLRRAPDSSADVPPQASGTAVSPPAGPGLAVGGPRGREVRGRVGADFAVLRHLAGISWRVSPGGSLLTAAAFLIVAFGGAGVAQTQRYLIDGLRAHAGDPGVRWLVVPVLVVGGAQVAATVATRVAAHLRVNLVQKVEVELAQEIHGYTAGIPTIDHLERADHLDRVHLAGTGAAALASYGWSIAETGACALMIVLSAWLLALVDPALLLLAATTVPLLILTGRAQGALRRLTDGQATAARHETDLHNLTVDPAAAKEIRISGSGPELSARAAALWAATTDAQRTVLIRGSVLEAAGWACYLAGLAGGLLVVARDVIAGRIGTGALVLVVALATQLRFQLWALRLNYSAAARGGRVAAHYRWLRDHAAQATPADATGVPPARLTGGITLESVTFHYPGTDTPVLRSVSAHLPAGSVIGLVGVNGAGKSTLVKLLTGLYRPAAGRILVDGRPLTTLDPGAWAAVSCGVFQDFARLHLTVRETVGVGDLPTLAAATGTDGVGDAVAADAAITRALTAARATALVDALPAGLDTPLGTMYGGVDLSGGQWQRLALARGLLRTHPLLLILDEPTAALDPQAEHDLFHDFAHHARQAAARTGAVTVLVSHRFSTVSMADHVIVIADGRVQESGTHTDLLASGGRYAELYTAQARGYTD